MTTCCDEVIVERKESSFGLVMSNLSGLIRVIEKISREVIVKPIFNYTVSNFK